ncbi:hypothetical protein D9M73_203240 [compost metagenome]
MAAAPGRTICDGLDNWPSRTSRFTSRPISRKNSAIRPSLIHSSKGLAIFSAPIWATTGVSSRPLYSHDSGELLMIRARTAAAISNRPLAASN